MLNGSYKYTKSSMSSGSSSNSSMFGSIRDKLSSTDQYSDTSESPPLLRKVKMECEDSSTSERKSRKGKIVDKKIVCTTEANVRSRRDEVITALKGDFYDVSTDTLSWKPRLLNVPSKEYPDIDSAVCKLKPNAGGYVIKLNTPGEYIMTRQICDQVDNLYIIGDDNPFVGVSYIQRCSMIYSTDPNIVIPPVGNKVYMPCTNCRGTFIDECRKCSGGDPFGSGFDASNICNQCGPNSGVTTASYGTGPFDISINGNTLSVKSVHGSQNNPVFTKNLIGTRIMIFSDQWITNVSNVTEDNGTRTGSVAFGTVSNADGNMIVFTLDENNHTVANNIQTSGGSSISAGSGFSFIPNIRIKITTPEFNISALKYLKIKGVEIHSIAPLLYLNSPAGVVDVGNCYISNNVCYRGRYLLKTPNVYTGLVVLWPASNGEAYCQTFVGPHSHLQALSCIGLWHSCIFAYSASAIEAAHQSTIDLSNSWIISCCIGVLATLGSTVVLTGAVVCDNNYGIIATYMSKFGAVTPQIVGLTDKHITAGPWFINNGIMMQAWYSSYIIMPITGGDLDNQIPFIIDGKIYTTMESNPVGNINQLNSMIVITNNPFAPNNVTIGCDPTNPNNANITQSIYNSDGWGVTTPSFLETHFGNMLGTTSSRTIQQIQQSVDINRLNKNISRKPWNYHR